MTTPPQEPVNAAEEDPTVEAGAAPDTHGVGTARDTPALRRVTEESDVEDGGPETEVEVGLGPSD